MRRTHSTGRLILSQHPEEGWWDADSSTAFALEARHVSETENLPTTLLSRLVALVETAVGVASDELMDEPGVLTGGASWVDAAQGTTTGVAQVASEQEDGARVHRASKNRRSEAEAQASDCPLTCCTAAIAASMPRPLAALEAADVAATRVWTTLLCIAVLERMSSCWIHGDGDVYAQERERTIVDHAREWVERYAAERPALARVLADGAMAKHATHTTLLWHRACEQRVVELRRSEGITAQMHRSQLHRTATGLVRAFIARNQTFAAFLSQPLGGLQRWQMFMVRCEAGLRTQAPPPACSSLARLPALRRSLSRSCFRICSSTFGCSTPRASTAAPS